MNLIFDIESDGLLDTISTIWCLCAQDVESGMVYSFSDYDEDLPSLQEGLDLLQEADVISGHNVINFDIPAIFKVTGVNLMNKKVHDTFVMSKVFQYKRKNNYNESTGRYTSGHSMFDWGRKLGNQKQDFHDFSGYSKTMLEYCQQDVAVNVDTYKYLLGEYTRLYNNNPLIKKGLEVEHDCAKFAAITEMQGWNFDKPKALATKARMEQRMKEIESVLEPKLGTKTVYKDKEPKTPKFKMNGDYTGPTCKMLTEYFGYTVNPTDTHLMPPGSTFQRSSEVQIEVGQIKDVKEWLLNNGWEPDEYTRKKINGEWVNQGPKLTTSSLEKLGEIGLIIDEYYTLRSRHSVVVGWLDQLDSDGRLHGVMRSIGTPSFRCTHSVIVNLPGVEAVWGRELRELFIGEPGWKVVGADSSGNQLRGLAHYVDNEQFTYEVCFGNSDEGTDAHTRNAEALGISRKKAKTFLYCYLFGGGNGKLGSICSGSSLVKNGAQAREAFSSRIKGLEEMNAKLGEHWRNTEYQQGAGWIRGMDGRPLFVPQEHQCLNYLLQCAEGITCKAAVSYQMQKIKEEGLRAYPRLMMHDESAWTVHPDDAVRVGEILTESFREAPKWFNVEIMDGGAYCIGESYADVH